MTTTTDAAHVWQFFRSGGLDQATIDSAADYLHLSQLNPKLWVALTCPTRGLEFDSRTLDLIDTDKDGRIRLPEILAAVGWACQLLKNPADMQRGEDGLPLAAINDQHPGGQQLLTSAREILRQLGQAHAERITVAQTSDTARIYAQARFNGDGVLTPEVTADLALRATLEAIIATCGGVADRGGKPGVDQATLELFYKELQAFADWWQKGEVAAQAGNPVLPLGEKTPAAFDALAVVRAKVDDYFARCRLAAFDPRAASALNRTEADFVALATQDFSTFSAEVIGLPLARIEAHRALPGQWMVGRNDAGDVRFHQRHVAQILRRHRVVADHRIELSGLQLMGKIGLHRGRGELQRRLRRLGAEGRGQPWDQEDLEAVGRRDADLPPGQRGIEHLVGIEQLMEVVEQLVDRQPDFLGPFGQHHGLAAAHQ